MKKVLIFVIVIGFIFACYHKINKTQENYIEYKTRPATINDLSNVTITFPTNYSIATRFVPLVDIEELKIKVVLKDSDDFLLDSTIISMGNVQKDQQYILNYTISTNAVNIGKKIKTCEINVSSGIISYTIDKTPGIYA